MIFNGGLEMPNRMNYTVTCNTNDAEILYASVEDIWKPLKSEKKILRALNNQYLEKYPDQNLTDKFFEQAFSNKLDGPCSAAAPKGAPGKKAPAKSMKPTLHLNTKIMPA